MMNTQVVPMLPRKHSLQYNEQNVSGSYPVEPAKLPVGVSCSDSALNQEYDPSVRHSGQKPRHYGSFAHDHQRVPKQHTNYSIKSAELHRKSEASNNLFKESQISDFRKREESRRKSDAILMRYQAGISKDSRHRSKSMQKDAVVIAHQQRSVVHVSGGSKDLTNSKYNTLPYRKTSSGGYRRVVTSQPLTGDVTESLNNPDWPVLSENEFENNGDIDLTEKDLNVVYGLNTVTESVKGLMKFLYTPFQCCKKNVSFYCCEFILWYAHH